MSLLPHKHSSGVNHDMAHRRCHTPLLSPPTQSCQTQTWLLRGTWGPIKRHRQLLHEGHGAYFRALHAAKLESRVCFDVVDQFEPRVPTVHGVEGALFADRGAAELLDQLIFRAVARGDDLQQVTTHLLPCLSSCSAASLSLYSYTATAHAADAHTVQRLTRMPHGSSKCHTDDLYLFLFKQEQQQSPDALESGLVSAIPACYNTLQTFVRC